MKKYIITSILTFILLIVSEHTFAQKQDVYFRIISADSLNNILKGKHGKLLDVRTPGEFKKGHIPGAINIDFLDDNFSMRIDSLDKNEQYEVYCHSGGRSDDATKLMQKKSFKRILHFDGGFSKWLTTGYAIAK